MLAQAQYYRNENVRRMTDEKYGDGASDFFARAMEAFYGKEQVKGQCKIVCVFGKKWLLFGKNSDMTILIEKEYSVKETKGQPINGALKQAITKQLPEREHMFAYRDLRN